MRYPFAMLSTPAIDNPFTGSERIARKLEERILAGEFAPGTPLREQELAAELGLSRHATREVLRILASRGVAEYLPFRGVRIPLLSADDVTEIYDARRAVECGALEQFGERADVAHFARLQREFTQAVEAGSWDEAFERDVCFHAFIVALAQSRRLSAWHGDLMKTLRLGHLLSPEFRERGLTDSVQQHSDVVLSLAAGDRPQAVAALHRHLDGARCLLLQGLPEDGRRKPRGAAA